MVEAFGESWWASFRNTKLCVTLRLAIRCRLKLARDSCFSSVAACWDGRGRWSGLTRARRSSPDVKHR